VGAGAAPTNHVREFVAGRTSRLGHCHCVPGSRFRAKRRQLEKNQGLYLRAKARNGLICSIFARNSGPRVRRALWVSRTRHLATTPPPRTTMKPTGVPGPCGAPGGGGGFFWARHPCSHLATTYATPPRDFRVTFAGFSQKLEKFAGFSQNESFLESRKVSFVRIKVGPIPEVIGAC